MTHLFADPAEKVGHDFDIDLALDGIGSIIMQSLEQGTCEDCLLNLIVMETLGRVADRYGIDQARAMLDNADVFLDELESAAQQQHGVFFDADEQRPQASH